ncbi:MAG: hypothetical protein NTW54_11950 [Bacteroidetes bacterium]|nr:hypothetical protein [Bacteroidota bacterium]
MKHFFLFLLTLLMFSSCMRKTDVKVPIKDTLRLLPPAALDTLELQTRPVDSVLNTRRY